MIIIISTAAAINFHLGIEDLFLVVKAIKTIVNYRNVRNLRKQKRWWQKYSYNIQKTLIIIQSQVACTVFCIIIQSNIYLTFRNFIRFTPLSPHEFLTCRLPLNRFWHCLRGQSWKNNKHLYQTHNPYWTTLGHSCFDPARQYCSYSCITSNIIIKIMSQQCNFPAVITLYKQNQHIQQVEAAKVVLTGADSSTGGRSYDKDE